MTSGFRNPDNYAALLEDVVMSLLAERGMGNDGEIRSLSQPGTSYSRYNILEAIRREQDWREWRSKDAKKNA